MGFLRRIAGFLGFAKDDGHEVKDEDDDDHHHHHHHEDGNTASQPRNRVHMKETGLPRKGFSVPVQVAVDRSHPGPLLAPCNSGDGGLQYENLLSYPVVKCRKHMREIHNIHQNLAVKTRDVSPEANIMK